HGSRVHLAFDAPTDAFRPPDNALLLEEDALKLTRAEAYELAGDQLAKTEVQRQHKDCGGKIERFLDALPGRPQGVRANAAEGPVALPPPHGQAADMEALLEVLASKKRWMAALDVAVQHRSEHLPAILAEAGHAYLQRGLHKRLWRLIRDLSCTDETVLFWRLSAAARVGEAESVRAEVEAYLAEHEAPQLRALYAGALATAQVARSEAERARNASGTALTLYQYGRCHEDAEQGAVLLRESVRTAEATSPAYEVVRNAGALAGKLTALGQYREAATWAAWALERFDGAGMGDASRRLVVLNNWAYARILTGETAGLEDALREGERQLGEVSPRLQRLFRSTVADYYLVSGDLEAAHQRYRRNWEGADRALLGRRALGLTRVLLEMGKADEAVEVARRAYVLTKDEHILYHRFALLALGMSQAMSAPRHAVAHLQSALEAFRSHTQAPWLAQAGLYLAKAHLNLDGGEAARGVLTDVSTGLQQLSATGLAYLSGPETDFRDVWEAWRGGIAPLELRFLGRQQVWFENARLDLPPRYREILAILTLKPDGLNFDQLHDYLGGENVSKNAVRTALTCLRKDVSISKMPYRLNVGVHADFLEVKDLLGRGEVTRALELYRGPLLRGSEAPLLVQAREELDEAMRQAVLSQNDAEVLLAFAEKSEDDLMLWEAALHALPPNDTRAPLLQARVSQIHKDWER
ncbi:MAG TPA: hypothetical protein VF171_03855, partial [Trueperaceae bacterium]